MSEYDEDLRWYPRTITTACGQEAWFDRNGSYPAYRCTTCLCVYGSVGMPDACHEAIREERAFQILRDQD